MRVTALITCIVLTAVLTALHCLNVKKLALPLGYGVQAEGSFIAFCALSDTTAIAMARGLRFFLQAP